jgi:cortexillin 1/2
LEKRQVEKVTQLTVQFADGLTVVHFVELLCEKKIKKKYTQKPTQKIHKIENTHLAMEFLKENGVEPKYLTIAAEDFIDGNLKLILGFLWMLFRKFRIAKAMGTDNIDSTTEALLTWCREITKGYKGVNIKDFKSSFNDGNAFLAMVHAFDNKLFKYDEQLEEHSTSENIESAFNMAEKALGIPQLLTMQDLMDGTIDERSVVLYVSLYFHAFVSAEEKNKIEKEKRAVTEKMTDLESELDLLTKKVASKEEELTQLRGKYEEQEKAYRKLEKEKELLASEVNDLKDQYKRLKEAVDARQRLELGGLDALRKNLLEHLRDMNVWKDYLEQDRSYESEKVQIRAEAEIADRSFEDQLEYLTDALGSENKRLDELLAQRRIEEAEKKAAQSATPADDDAPLSPTSDSGDAKKKTKKKPAAETVDGEGEKKTKKSAAKH